MGKKKTSSGKHYTSKGEVGTDRKITNAIRRERNLADIEIKKLDAWLKGKNAYTTIANPNTNQTNKRFIRVKLRDEKGDPREHAYHIHK